MTIIDNVLNIFPQNNTIIKSGKELLMSGELNLSDLTATSVSIVCYIGKKKRELNQSVEGNVNSLQAYVQARPDVSPTITTHDLLVTERGEVFMVGAVTQRNNGTTINGDLDFATYLYAELEIYEDA